MKTLEFTSRGTAQRQSGLPVYEVGQRVKILRDVGKYRKPYGTIQDIQRRRGRLVLVVLRDQLPPDTGKGRPAVWTLILSTAMVTPLYWRGPAKTSRHNTKRGPARHPYTPIRRDEVESVRYIG